MENIIFSTADAGPRLETLTDKLSLEELSSFVEEFNGEANIYDLENYYKSTYNVKSLQQILQYYNIPKKNMVKDEMIQRLVFFEMEPENHNIVIHRMRLWQNINELKKDTFFSKYINFTI
jgi:hypothetical protein